MTPSNPLTPQNWPFLGGPQKEPSANSIFIDIGRFSALHKMVISSLANGIEPLHHGVGHGVIAQNYVQPETLGWVQYWQNFLIGRIFEMRPIRKFDQKIAT